MNDCSVALQGMVTMHRKIDRKLIIHKASQNEQNHVKVVFSIFLKLHSFTISVKASSKPLLSRAESTKSTP